MSIRLECIRCKKAAPSMSSYNDEGLCPDCVFPPLTRAEYLVARVCEATFGESVDNAEARNIVRQLNDMGFFLVSMKEIEDPIARFVEDLREKGFVISEVPGA